MDKILLFIPMYNCEKQIIRVLTQINDDVMQYFSEILIVNNRSTDKSEEVVIDYIKNNTNLPIKLIRNDGNYGLGGSHKVAFQYAIDNNFNYITVLHGDDQAEIKDIIPYLKDNEHQKCDCLLGARFMIGSKLKGYSKFRTFGNYVFNFLFTLGLGTNIYDLDAGLNIFKTDSVRNKFYIKFKDNLVFGYCLKMGLVYHNQKIKFFPILWKEEDQVSSVKLVNQAVTVLLSLLFFILDRDKFMKQEHRDKIIDNYTYQTIFPTNN